MRRKLQMEEPTDHKPAKADLLMRQARRNKIAGLDGDNEQWGRGPRRMRLCLRPSRMRQSYFQLRSVFQQCMHLRKLCNHLFTSRRYVHHSDDLYHRYLVSASGKMCIGETGPEALTARA